MKISLFRHWFGFYYFDGKTYPSRGISVWFGRTNFCINF